MGGGEAREERKPTSYIINPVRHFTDGIETQAEL
jgi:hypothetical protein